MQAPLLHLLPLLFLVLSASALAQTTSYPDGALLRPITAEPSLRVVFPPTAAPRLQSAQQPLSRSDAAHASPVWREGTSRAGRLIALPGGVIVELSTHWSDTQVHAWAQNKGLDIARRLNMRGNWYLLATPPGTAALQLAQQLHASGEVISVTPNWWKETHTR